jgi:hypothetical protein
MCEFKSDWMIISDDTRALTHDILMRIATGDKSEKTQKHVQTLAVSIYGPQHDKTAAKKTFEELQSLKEVVRTSIKRLREELENCE